MDNEKKDKEDKAEDDIEEKEKISDQKQTLVEKIKENPWKTSTVVFGVILLVFLFSNFSGLTGSIVTGSVVSEETAGKALLNFANQQGANAELVGVDDIGDFYEVTLMIQGTDVPLMVTKDGKYFLSGDLIPMEISSNSQESLQSSEISKSDKPVVEAFLSPYCPYGLQFEKGLIPVYDLLKNKADINIKLMSPTHMQEEEPEIKKELCILEESGKDKYFDFLEKIVYNDDASECYNVYHGINLQTNEPIDSEYIQDGEYFALCMDSIIEQAMIDSGIDPSIIEDCVSLNGDNLYSEAVAYVRDNPVSGSPTLMINGQKISAQSTSKGAFYIFNNEEIPYSRSPETIKTIICSLFNKAPSECSQELDTETFSPGIGETASSGSSAGVC